MLLLTQKLHEDAAFMLFVVSHSVLVVLITLSCHFLKTRWKNLVDIKTYDARLTLQFSSHTRLLKRRQKTRSESILTRKVLKKILIPKTFYLHPKMSLSGLLIEALKANNIRQAQCFLTFFSDRKILEKFSTLSFPSGSNYFLKKTEHFSFGIYRRQLIGKSVKLSKNNALRHDYGIFNQEKGGNKFISLNTLPSSIDEK